MIVFITEDEKVFLIKGKGQEILGYSEMIYSAGTGLILIFRAGRGRRHAPYFGRGYSTRKIAEVLLISPKTVDSHRTRIKTKLAIERTAELLQQAVQWVQAEQIA